jgi:hypothetical protein
MDKLSQTAQIMVTNLERSPAMKSMMLARLQQMVDSGTDYDGTGKEVTDYFKGVVAS